MWKGVELSPAAPGSRRHEAATDVPQRENLERQGRAATASEQNVAICDDDAALRVRRQKAATNPQARGRCYGAKGSVKRSVLVKLARRLINRLDGAGSLEKVN